MSEISPTYRARLEDWLEQAAKGVEVVEHGGLLGWHVVVHNAQGGHEAAGTVIAGCPSELEAELVAAGLWRLVGTKRWEEPPSGWYTFGTHAGWDSVPPLEFHPELNEEDGLPKWERPRSGNSAAPHDTPRDPS